MKKRYGGGLVRGAAVLGLVLLVGCTELLQGPPGDSEPLGDGRVVITVGSGAERTAFPRMDQFSKIVLSFERKDGAGTMSPVEVNAGETVISLSPGTWEVTAGAYNRAEPPVVTALAKNTLTRAGDLITGNTYFALAPAGAGPGILRYTVTPPSGLSLDAARSRIRIEKDGEALESLNSGGFSAGTRAISGAIAGAELSLNPGSYTADIVLDDNASLNTAAFREAVVILPGLVTEIAFTPQAGDFLDPDVRAVLTNVTNVKFGRTKNNSSHTVIGDAGGGELNKTQALSVSNGAETVYFTLTKLQNQTITIGGANAGSVSYYTSGAVDGYTAKKTEAVFKVDIPHDLADYGGTWDFTLALGETGKTPVVYTVTINLPFLTYLGVDSWPTKWVYLIGEEFDPAGLELVGFYTDGSKAPISGGYTVEGFDTVSAGDRIVRIKKYGILGIDTTPIVSGNQTIKDSFLVTVVSARRLVFDPELEAEHNAVKGKPITHIGPPPSGYTVSPGRTVVLAPIKFLIPDNAVYEWKVNGVTQASTTEYLPFAYNSFGAGNHTVTVTAKINGSPAAAGTTTVSAVSGAVQRPAEAASQGAAEKLFSVVAPGQFGSTSGRLGSYNGFGGYGGYAVFRFDHSVPKNGTDGKEIKVGGNTGVWTEPGAVWVSMDENNNGVPDDTWYELKGSHTLNTYDTLRRYAVTFRDDYTWTDNLGGGGTYPKIQGYQSYSDYLGQGRLTLVGTRLHHRLIGSVSVWGYADAYDDQRNSFSDAIQADGTPADLPFVDFVKIVTAIHYADPLLGERSTEAGTPKDMTINDPEMMLEGQGAPGGDRFNYTFRNDSGYDLIITFDGEEFDLPRKGTQMTVVTKTSSSSVVYIDYRGGNVTLSRNVATATFTNGPEE